MLFYGVDEGNQLQAKNIQTDITGVNFDVFYKGKLLENFTIPMYGTHNVLNSLAVIGVCLIEGLPMDLVKEQLSTFKGVKRRFSEKRVSSNILIDDYAHHPTEIKATIEAVRAKYPEKKLVSIFQPHTYTRTQMFLNEFADSLSASDEVYLCEIFGSARESVGNLSIQDLMNRIPDSRLICEGTVDQLTTYTECILLFMGAGDIQKIQRAFEETVVV